MNNSVETPYQFMKCKTSKKVILSQAFVETRKILEFIYHMQNKQNGSQPKDKSAFIQYSNREILSKKKLHRNTPYSQKKVRSI